MKKEPSIQKKKTPMITFLDILFKVLVGIAVIIFTYIIYTKSDLVQIRCNFLQRKKSIQMILLLEN